MPLASTQKETQIKAKLGDLFNGEVKYLFDILPPLNQAS